MLRNFTTMKTVRVHGAMSAWGTLIIIAAVMLGVPTMIATYEVAAKELSSLKRQDPALKRLETRQIIADQNLMLHHVWEPRLRKKVRGLMVPLHHATISSRLQATIRTIGPGSGEPFRKGDTLVDFDCAIHKAEFMRAEAQMSAAQDSYRIKSELARNGTISKLQTVLAQAELKKAEAERVLTSERVAYCTIKAPYNGRIVRRLANAHETVNFGDPLIEIVNDVDIELQLYVPSKWLPHLKIGIPFQFHVDETGAELTAKIIAIGAWVDNVSQLIEIRATFAQKIVAAVGWEDTARSAPLLAGMSGHANFSNIVGGHSNFQTRVGDKGELRRIK